MREQSNERAASDGLDLSVVVPTHRRPEMLSKLLRSLADQTFARGRFEVIVVDDASDDRTPDVLRDARGYVPNLQSVTMDRRYGVAVARNRGIEVASGEVVLFLDDDIVATPNLLAEHVRDHAEANDPLLAILGRIDWHPDIPRTIFMRWLDASGLQFAYDTWLQEGRVDEPYRAFYPANLSVPRAALVKVGGFDERFFLGFEDYELGYRLVQIGLRMDYRPAALAYHVRKIDLRTFRRRTAMQVEGALLLKELHPDYPLPEGILDYRVRTWKRAALWAYLPVAGLVGNEARRGQYYWATLAEAYARAREQASSSDADEHQPAR